MWAEPCLLEDAKKEYNGVIEEFLATGEKLFGPYVWGRCGIGEQMGFVKLSSCFPHSWGCFPSFCLPEQGFPIPETQGGRKSKGRDEPGSKWGLC